MRCWGDQKKAHREQPTEKNMAMNVHREKKTPHGKMKSQRGKKSPHRKIQFLLINNF